MKTNYHRNFVDQGDYKEWFPDGGCERYHHASQHRKHRVKKQIRRVERRNACAVINEQLNANVALQSY